jgi:hypothetical protein
MYAHTNHERLKFIYICLYKRWRGWEEKKKVLTNYRPEAMVWWDGGIEGNNPWREL